MGDSTKPSDDEAWTELERSFFAAAPPDVPDPAAPRAAGDDLVSGVREPLPSGEHLAWVRRRWAAGSRKAASARHSLAAARGAVVDAARRVLLAISSSCRRTLTNTSNAWRRTKVGLTVAGAEAWGSARAGTTRVISRLATRLPARWGVAVSLASVVLVATAFGFIGYRSARIDPPAASVVARTTPEAPVAPAVTFQPHVAASRSQRDGGSKPKAHNHRKVASKHSSQPHPVVTAFTERTTKTTSRRQPAPVPAGRPFFSR